MSASLTPTCEASATNARQAIRAIKFSKRDRALGRLRRMVSGNRPSRDIAACIDDFTARYPKFIRSMLRLAERMAAGETPGICDGDLSNSLTIFAAGEVLRAADFGVNKCGRSEPEVIAQQALNKLLMRLRPSTRSNARKTYVFDDYVVLRKLAAWAVRKVVCNEFRKYAGKPTEYQASCDYGSQTTATNSVTDDLEFREMLAAPPAVHEAILREDRRRRKLRKKRLALKKCETAAVN